MFSIKFPRRMLIVILSPLLAACQFSGAEPIKPFTSDGCSQFPDGTYQHRDLWLKCCTAHDQKYWAGGSYDERLQADLALRSCVQSVGEPAIAELMLAGVRVGGSPWWPSSFRWGYGWSYTHGYRVLSSDELKQVHKLKNEYGNN